jgi:uracil-DNA glycosylase
VRHIVLEGPDGAGKTTLAQSLMLRYGFAYHHEGPPPTDADPLLHHYARLITDAKVPTVFDRLHLGEMVYGPLLRGKSRITAEESKLMNRLLLGTGSIVIGCLPQFGTCLRNNRAKEELIKDERLLAEAYAQWQRLFYAGAGYLLPNGAIHDYESSQVILNSTEALGPGAIGAPRARFLFVGEKPAGELDLPFFRAEGRSSGFLNQAISEAGFRESMCSFTNAQYPDGRARNIASILAGFHKQVTVITLGTIASKASDNQRLRDMRIVRSVKNLPHPAYWKRFHSAEQPAYVEMLKEIHDAA